MLFSKKKAKTFGDVEKSSYLCTRNSEIRHALVAQLVEHLTLNQGVQGSSPCRRTKRRFQPRWSRLFLSTYSQFPMFNSLLLKFRMYSTFYNRKLIAIGINFSPEKSSMQKG